MKRTVSIPIQPNPADFLPLIEEYSTIFNSHMDWALENKTYNQLKAHSAFYKQIKQHSTIPTAFLQTVRDTTMQEKKYSGLRFDRRTMTLREEQLPLSSLGKRAKIIWTLKGATFTYSIQSEQFWSRPVYETSPCKTDEEVLGIDRGLQQLAVTSEGQFFSNREIRAFQRRHLHNRKTAQSKGASSARKRLKMMSGKKKQFSRDVNHQVTKQLVHLDSIKTHVLEDLRGIRRSALYEAVVASRCRKGVGQAVVTQPHVTIGNNQLPCAVDS